MTTENSTLKFDGQINFAGGCWMVGAVPDNGYRWAKNIVIRDGKAKTRPGFRAAFQILQGGFREAFYFNQDNARYNDETHTGFWFPYTFVGSAWENIQGMGVVRFLDDENVKIILVSAGRIYVHDNGYVNQLSAAETIAATETITFVQAMNWVYMFRGENNNVLRWDGGPNGFVAVPDPSSGSRIVNASTATYMAGRLWIPRDRDDIYVSDVLDGTAYDYVHQLFSVSPGDGNEITAIGEFHEDTALIFKDRAIYYITGINSAVVGGTFLSDYVKIGAIDTDHGLVAKNAWVKYGEQVAYLSYRGICTIARNAQGKLEGVSAPLSAPIQPIIDRINWDSVSCACATYFNNYLLFAVPIDGKTYNNTVLVYDVQLGVWVGEWQSEWLRPVGFYSVDEKMYFLGTDGRLRLMFCDDPWDSENALVDIDTYDADTLYYAGEHVTYEAKAGDKAVYRALVDTIGNLPTNKNYWVEETDTSPHVLCAVKSELWTRFFEWNDPTTGKRFQRGEVMFEHQNPKITIEAESEAYNTVKALLTDKTYDRKKYDICDTEDWNTSNVNLDFRNPHRQDYTLFIDKGSNVGLGSNEMGTYGLHWNATPVDVSDLYGMSSRGLYSEPQCVASDGSGTVLLAIAAPSLPFGLYTLYISTDYGLTFTYCSALFDYIGSYSEYAISSIALVDANTWYVAQANRVYKTTDGGTTWSCIYTVGAASATGPKSMTAFSDGLILLVDKDNQIHRSLDAGVSWDTPSTGILLTSPYNLGFMRAENGYIYAMRGTLRSLDNGETWESFQITDSSTPQGIYEIDGKLIASSSSGFVETSDHFATSRYLQNHVISGAMFAEIKSNNNIVFLYHNDAFVVYGDHTAYYYKSLPFSMELFTVTGNPIVDAGNGILIAIDKTEKRLVRSNLDCLFGQSEGIPLNIWTPHSHRFIPIMSKDKSMGLRIKNDLGKLAVTSIRLSGTYNRFANRRT